jgi:hypothetical protein
VPGVFAAGDVRFRSIKRVASAVGDGATAVRVAHEFLTSGPEQNVCGGIGRRIAFREGGRIAVAARPAFLARSPGSSLAVGSNSVTNDGPPW